MMLNVLKMISNLCSAEAENLLVVAGEATLKKVTSAAEWKKILVCAGQFFIENEKEENQFFDDLSLALSKENMAQLAKNLTGKLFWIHVGTLIFFLTCRGRWT